MTTHRVLLAARRETQRRRWRTCLRRAGHEVVASCGDARTTLSEATRTRAAVCVIHHDLPGGGIAACRALAARKTPPRIVIVASTAHDVGAALRAGADAFVVEGIAPAAISTAVDDVAARRPHLSIPVLTELIGELRAPVARRTRVLKGDSQ